MLGLFNPDAARTSLTAQLLEEFHRKEPKTFGGEYVKRANRSNRVKIVDGIPYQACGGGRRRLSTRSDY